MFPAQYLGPDWTQLQASYTRHLLTPFFQDFGIPGCCVAMLVLGTIYGYLYRKARERSVKRQESWPLMIYLTLVIAARPLISDGVALGIVGALGSALGLTLCLILSGLFSGQRIRDQNTAKLYKSL
jgi:hypothetical protein